MLQVTCLLELENDDEFTPEAWEFLAPDAGSAESRLVACVTEYVQAHGEEGDSTYWGEAISELLGTPEYGELLARHGLARPEPSRIAVVIEREYHEEVVAHSEVEGKGA